VKFIVILAIGYIIYKMYRIGQINGAIQANQKSSIHHQNQKNKNSDDKEYTDFEEIK